MERYQLAQEQALKVENRKGLVGEPVESCQDEEATAWPLIYGFLVPVTIGHGTRHLLKYEPFQLGPTLDL